MPLPRIRSFGLLLRYRHMYITHERIAAENLVSTAVSYITILITLYLAAAMAYTPEPFESGSTVKSNT